MTVAPPSAFDTGPPASRHRRPGRVRRLLPLLGPAVVAATAYVDPGNVATNRVFFRPDVAAPEDPEGVITSGFLRRRVPLRVRRGVTLAPALLLAAVVTGVDGDLVVAVLS
ncbi:hypothetical protein PHK61_00480 [Actinomycetospora lutea]|uniref:hypothetical protein n=1 Tax=Actinomycetospora lutea TaxID=663604 RepID=UPI002365F32A|nr:hypothetical protein [Actinomycetospora lutea]MDD7936891.1 hypothetical protein [Actinomycetospora lutea]